MIKFHAPSFRAALMVTSDDRYGIRVATSTLELFQELAHRAFQPEDGRADQNPDRIV
jgi:hypothetical protein